MVITVIRYQLFFFLPVSGYHKEHKKVEDYFSTVSQKAKQKDHQAFLSSRKNWIKQHNEAGPDKKRLLSKKELVEAHKELQIQHKTGGRFLAPKKQFVTAENWIEAKHGKWDPAKVVTEKVFGNSVQGVWLAKGEKGVYDFEEYDDTGIQEQDTVHDSSQTACSEEGLARKRKALMHDFASGSQARDKAAVQSEGKELSLEDVMELLNNQTSGQVSAGKVSADLL